MTGSGQKGSSHAVFRSRVNCNARVSQSRRLQPTAQI
ncbi:hypothetical protein J2847_005587 [Azospirillum agricola]|nr:hypothetical protein [Azospirillum agricola]